HLRPTAEKETFRRLAMQVRSSGNRQPACLNASLTSGLMIPYPVFPSHVRPAVIGFAYPVVSRRRQRTALWQPLKAGPACRGVLRQPMETRLACRAVLSQQLKIRPTCRAVHQAILPAMRWLTGQQIRKVGLRVMGQAKASVKRLLTVHSGPPLSGKAKGQSGPPLSDKAEGLSTPLRINQFRRTRRPLMV